MNRKIVQFVAVLHYHGDILTLMHAPAQTNVHNDTHIYMDIDELSELHFNTKVT